MVKVNVNGNSYLFSMSPMAMQEMYAAGYTPVFLSKVMENVGDDKGGPVMVMSFVAYFSILLNKCLVGQSLIRANDSVLIFAYLFGSDKPTEAMAHVKTLLDGLVTNTIVGIDL